MKPQECPSFDGCDAPLCPLDAQSLAHGIWYPDEAICAAHGRTEHFLAIQRRIARKTKDPERGYFTAQMLSVLAVVGRAIKGLSPANADRQDEERWIVRHRRPGISAEERERRRCRAIAHGFRAKDAVSNEVPGSISARSHAEDAPKGSGIFPEETPRTTGAGR